MWPRLPGSSWLYSWILDRFLTIATAEIPIPGLPAPFDGLTILFVSDVHAGPFLSGEAVSRAIAKLATLGADVVVHGGDLATSSVDEILEHREAIEGIAAPAGVFAVYGNHDHYTRDVQGVGRFLESCGARLLLNDAVALTRGGARIALAGIDDWNFGRPDLKRALDRARAVAPGAPVILISHNPDAALDAADRGVALTLSGHTHGGQIRIPGRPVLVRMSRYFLDDGRYVHEHGQIVVSRGLGVSGVPLRLWCAPEALLVTLRR